MKKLSSAALLYFISVHFSFGQSSFGVKIGASLANMNIDSEYLKISNTDNESRIGYQVGMIAQKDISQKVYVRPELIYASKGYKVNGEQPTTVQTAVRYNYLTLPILIGYRLSSDLSAFVGPQVGVLAAVHTKSENGGRSVNLKQVQDYNNIDFSIGAGVSYQFTTRINADFRYNYGLTTILNTVYMDSSEHKIESDLIKNNQTFEMSISYIFRIKE